MMPLPQYETYVATVFRPNRWNLYLTTRQGLGIFSTPDPYAPAFEFSKHFVADLFIDFSAAPHDTSFLENTVYHGIEYIEAPCEQDKFNTAQRTINTELLIHHLEFETAELESNLEDDSDLGFLGDPSLHLDAMRNAIGFLESHRSTPLYLIAYYDD